MRKYFIAALILIYSSAWLLFAKPIESYIRLTADSKAEINLISKFVSISEIDGSAVYAYANQDGLAGLTKNGLFYEELPHPNSQFSTLMAGSFREMREWDHYPTYEQYVDAMYRFADSYPEICLIENIGHSVENRELLFVKISDNVSIEENEPEFMYSAQMHGNEIVTFIMMLHLIDHILENYGSDEQITRLINNIEIWINPLANPDGTYNGGNHTVEDATRFNANGVDLNRNFPDFIDGPHPDGNDWQQENIAMMDFADQHNFVLSSNLHSGTECVNYPWDTTPVLTADDNWWQIVSHTYADTAQFYSPWHYMNEYDDGITNGYAWYEINGGRQDYMTYYKNCREMTLELSDAQMLDSDELLDHWDYNRASFLNYIEECLRGIQGVITNSAGDPLAATITVVGHDFDNSEVFTDPDHGNYHRLIAPGTYEILINAYGYEEQLFSGITVMPNNVTILNATLENLPEISVSGSVIDAENEMPIENAQVQLLDPHFQPVLTDENGQFEINSVFEDTYSFHIYAEGYAAILEEYSVSSENNVLQFELVESDIVSFESDGFPPGWQFFGQADWVIVDDTAADGLYSARSGDIGNDQYSILEFTMDVPVDDEISFFCKTACEDDDDNDWDFLVFKIDNIEIERWDGLTDWHQETYPVSEGIHTFSWTYSKDGSVSHYEDSAWIDRIDLPFGPDFSDIIPGDVNFDGQVNVMDIVTAVNFILNIITPNYEEFIAADVDQNGVINILDLISIVNLIVG